ncbi:hypothetical protein ACFP2F_08950 [Hymenobacter artigasi]|uniref:Uncharacterized protein n=1 Tax=Hymenobacter artigasi TaxID=2719616 RepID=A0ABX1HH54_9BACT|nr:hypothetical protein [Hymenobacter artigasi]NKI89385.1 hypothetical protein [Hymenobacter artigasi]
MPPTILLEETPASPEFRPSTSRKWLWQVGLLFSLLPLGRWSRTALPPAVATIPAQAGLGPRLLAPLPVPLVATQHEGLPMPARYYPAALRPALPTTGL